MMRKSYWFLSATLIVAVSCGGRAWAPEGEDALAGKIFAVFQEKCFSCHSPEGKADDPQVKKGMKHLDYIDDFAKLRGNAKFIVQGDAGKSLLHKQLVEDEMPPDDSGIKPLSDEQKDLVKQWIVAGAPAGKTVPLARAVATTGPAKQRTFMSRLIEFLGHFHPLAAHTPIAVLMAAAIAELLYLRHPAPALAGAARFCMVLGAMGAIATAALGWALAANIASKPVLETHRWAGTFAAAACIPIAILGEWGGWRAHREGRKWHGFSRVLFRVLVLGIAAFVGFTAHLGGLLEYGEHWFDFPG